MGNATEARSKSPNGLESHWIRYSGRPDPVGLRNSPPVAREIPRPESIRQASPCRNARSVHEVIASGRAEPSASAPVAGRRDASNGDGPTAFRGGPEHLSLLGREDTAGRSRGFPAGEPAGSRNSPAWWAHSPPGRHVRIGTSTDPTAGVSSGRRCPGAENGHGGRPGRYRFRAVPIPSSRGDPSPRSDGLTLRCGRRTVLQHSLFESVAPASVVRPGRRLPGRPDCRGRRARRSRLHPHAARPAAHTGPLVLGVDEFTFRRGPWCGTER